MEAVMQQMKQCPKCKAQQPLQAGVCSCGHQFRTRFGADGQPIPANEPDPTRMVERPQAYPIAPVEPDPQPVYYTPTHQTPERDYDICAILALAFAIVSLLVLPLVFGVAAFVLGFVAHYRTGPGKKAGRGMALAGIIVGLLGIGWAMLQMFD